MPRDGRDRVHRRDPPITDGWTERIRSLRDNDARFRTDPVVLTGSSAADLTASVKALAGRRGTASDPDRVLLPMGFRTFMGLLADEPVRAGLVPLRAAALTPSLLAEAAHALAPWLDVLVDGWEAYLLAAAPRRPCRVPDRPRGFPHHWFAGWSTPCLATRSDAPTGREHGRRVATADCERPVCPGSTPPRWPATSAPHCPAYAGVSTSCGRRSWCGPAIRKMLRPKLNARAKVYFTDLVYARLDAGVPATLPSCPSSSSGMALLRSFERDRPGSYLGFDRVLYHRTRTHREIDFVSVELGDWAHRAEVRRRPLAAGRADAACFTLARHRRHALGAQPRRSRCPRPAGGTAGAAARQLTEPAIHFTRTAGAFD